MWERTEIRSFQALVSACCWNFDASCPLLRLGLKDKVLSPGDENSDSGSLPWQASATEHLHLRGSTQNDLLTAPEQHHAVLSCFGRVLAQPPEAEKLHWG